ncbi:MAG: mycofactocin precursor MftA [Nakamurella sp.]
MPDTAVQEQVATAIPAPVGSVENATEAPLQISDLLVEDVSIDGMCGVY